MNISKNLLGPSVDKLWQKNSSFLKHNFPQ